MARILSLVCFAITLFFAECLTESENVYGGGYGGYAPPKHPQSYPQQQQYGGGYSQPKPQHNSYGGGYSQQKPQHNSYGGGYGAPKPQHNAYGGGYGAPQHNNYGGGSYGKPDHGDGYGDEKASGFNIFAFHIEFDDFLAGGDCVALDTESSTAWDFCSTEVDVAEKCSGKKKGTVTTFCKYDCGRPIADDTKVSHCEYRFEFYGGDFTMEGMVQHAVVMEPTDTNAPDAPCMSSTNGESVQFCQPGTCDITSESGIFKHTYGEVISLVQNTDFNSASDFTIDIYLVVSFKDKKEASHGGGYGGGYPPQQHGGGYPQQQPQHGGYGGGYSKPSYGGGYQKPASNYGGGYQKPASNYGGGYQKPSSGYGGYEKPASNYGGGYEKPASNYGGGYQKPASNYGGGYQKPASNHGGGYQKPASNYGGYQKPASNYGGYQKPASNYGGGYKLLEKEEVDEQEQ